MNVSSACSRIANSAQFRGFVIAVIVVAGALIGVQTYPSLVQSHHFLFEVLDRAILSIFVLEICIKMAAEGRHPYRYFKDPWNVFDFSIVAVCFLPFGGAYVAVLRLARILRVLRLITVLPKLQVLVGALLHSIPSIAYITVLLSLHFYIYAVIGTMLFGKNDPTHFGTLHISLVSLFRVVTLEDWTDLMYTQMYGSDVYNNGQLAGLAAEPSAAPIIGALFFISFILLGTMIILNLFIGVIMNGMSEMQREHEHLAHKKRREETEIISISDDIAIILQDLAKLQQHLDLMQRLYSTQARSPIPPDFPQ